MDDTSFLERIRSSPGDAVLLREYAEWLTEHDDPRGGYLTAELDLRDTEMRLLQLRSAVGKFAAHRGLDANWLDLVVPLTVRSPMRGTFYAAPAPDESPFVKIGDICHPETIIGIIEAMHVYNTIPAGHYGVVSEVLASSGLPVAYGDPLVQLTRPPSLLSGG
ncbi:MAG: accB 1 [Planctomycetaceae bacterium]|nr:accB 1 [Planctomycetaceae bacterium]